MHSRRFGRSVQGRAWAGALILLALLVIQTGPSCAATQVLVINSYHSGLTWTDSVMDGIRETFSRSGRDVQLSAEYLDARRFVDPGRARMIRELIIAKLAGTRPDIVVASDNAALEFVLAERDRLFKDIPVIFLGINDFRPSMIARYPKITGVAEDLSVAETVALALRLHPGTREIVVVGRTSVPADRANREAFVSAMREPPRGVAVSYWDDLPVSELKERLLKLGSGSILFLNGLMTDEAGRQMMYGETTNWVRRHSSVPVYSFWSVYLGHGIVGGKLVSGKEQGRRAAELAVAVLGGADTGRLPVISASDANRYMFDYRELERFGIPISKLPKGSEIVNRPDSIYHSHKGFILASAAVVLVLSGLVILFIVLMVRRRRAEEALRKSEEKYRDIFERAVEGIFQSTPDGRFLSVNPSFARMLGYGTPGELLNDIVNIPEQMYVHPEERALFKDALEKSGSVVTGLEHEFKRKDGSVIWVSTNARAVRDRSGAIIYYEGTSENITERKEAEKEIRRLNEDLERRVRERTAQLEAANKELEAFSYSVSHDLRAPLRAIDGYARIITEDYAPLLDAEGMRVCGVVQENARRMGQLIDNLLSFSRLSRATMQWLVVDMGTLADSVFHEVTTPETRERIEFRIDHLPGAPGDPTLIRQVWTNLLSNAVKFTSKREKAVIEVGSSAGEDEIIYFVRDNGAGFDMRYVDKLFGVFQRLHGEREFEGTGVGLAIVQRVIQRHGGRVWAEGEEGRGASFFFTLPAKRE